MNVLNAVLVLGILGALFGLILAVASKIFFVKVDEREEKIMAVLPGANCGGCGYPGCGGCAAAIVKGDAPVNACVPGGNAVGAQIAEIMGVRAESAEKKVAHVRCSGQNVAKLYEYIGIHDCVAAQKCTGAVTPGQNVCVNGCLGFGNCVKACAFGAISVQNGVAKVDREKCTGCMSCAAACPKKLIEAVPYSASTMVSCSNTDKGAVARKLCDVSCIGCGICQKNCPSDAIHVANNIAAVDYSKCTGCGVCVEKCPRHIIVMTGNKATV